MTIEETRELLLGDVDVFKQRPDLLDLYFYHLYGDDVFITPDLRKSDGKVSKKDLNEKNRSLILLLGWMFLREKGVEL
ncbi:MAG: hypothetical protein ACRCZ9_08485 [Fusobacteriaceae bacterium]